ncbi:uncharacterized protein LOC116428548 [Nomia melanderi]|uniref:uncharacterized protein LOC116428548 n=1 Tax=Nomia melanderi TaxID=2448451 RepID=UPI0013042D0A|nr:uncharacterized protein LOC116428548 [Nomia melanderi]
MAGVTTFVRTIEKYPCLYDNTSSEYARKDITENAWSDVANKMNWSVADCKEKWKNIRNGFVRSLKPAQSGSTTRKRKRYYLHDIMQFVLPYVKPVAHIQDFDNFPPPQTILAPTIPSPSISPTDMYQETKQEQAETEDIIQNLLSQTQDTTLQNSRKCQTKRKTLPADIDKSFINYVQKNHPFNDSLRDDPRRMFLLSLLPDIAKFSDIEMREFKMKVLMLINEISTRSEHEHLTPTSTKYLNNFSSSPSSHIPPTSPLTNCTSISDLNSTT